MTANKLVHYYLVKKEGKIFGIHAGYYFEGAVTVRGVPYGEAAQSKDRDELLSALEKAVVKVRNDLNISEIEDSEIKKQTDEQ